MSEQQRRPTIRVGRRRDPRAETLPPAESKSSLPPAAGSRRSLTPGEREPGRYRRRATEPPEALARAADADEMMGRLLARATQAETRVRALEQVVARLNEDRLLLEARIADLEAGRKPKADLSIAAARALATELLSVLERL